MKSAIVFGAGGFIGNHMVNRLVAEGFWVRGVDLKLPEFSQTKANEFFQGDLRNYEFVQKCFRANGKIDEIYQFAADMGGAEYVFSGDNDADIMHNSAVINLNILDLLQKSKHNERFSQTKIFYSSSACMYPEYNQLDPDNPNCEESSAYPANPDSEYGWEKLFSERLYLSYSRNYKIPIAIARYHNIYGPEGTWDGGREKAPAAICRKIVRLPESGGSIEVWGDGCQTRSFLYIDDCIEASRRLMTSDYGYPINIGSDQMVTINELVNLVEKISGKRVLKNHKLDAPTGVRGRNSSNKLIKEILNWDFSIGLSDGLEATYAWILTQDKSQL